MKKCIIVFINIMCLSILLSACQKDTATESPDLEYILKSQISTDKDDYLELYSVEGDYLEILKLDTIYYGSYTSEDIAEVMAIFKVLGVPHAGGFDRTIVAVYNADSLEIVTQKTFAADAVSIYFLNGYMNKIKYILVISDDTHNGYSSYNAELYSLWDGTWTAKSMPIDNSDNNLAYAITNDSILHIFKLSYEGYEPIYDYIDTFFWNIEEFVDNIP